MFPKNPHITLKTSVKDRIIDILGHNHPLTLAKITNNIKKQGVSVTFQGVRRAVQAMVDEKILIKKDRNYDLDKEWIMETKESINNLFEIYFSEESSILNIEELGEDMKIYTFPNLIESDKFWNKIVSKWFEEDKDSEQEKIYPQLSGHTWYVFGQMGEETAIFDKMKSKGIDFYIFCSGNTLLDKWCKKYYESLGGHFTNSASNKDNLKNKYFSVYKDHIIQTEHPKEIAEEIEKIYQSTKKFENFDATKLTKILLKKSEIRVIVMKNKLLAEQLRENVMRHFRKESKHFKTKQNFK